MTTDRDTETSLDLMGIAAKYIISSVVAIAIGAISIVYAMLFLLVYGSLFIELVLIGAFFTGIAFLIIGVFLSAWGIFWMRSEGKRLKKRMKKEQQTTLGGPDKKKATHKKTSINWEEISDKAYGRIEWYASRFMVFSTIGIVVGFIAIVYAVLNISFFTAQLYDISVILGVFVGVGAIVGSIVLLSWGIFWRKQAEKRTLF